MGAENFYVLCVIFATTAKMSGTQDAPARKSELVSSLDLRSGCQRVINIGEEVKVVLVQCREGIYSCQKQYCNGSIVKCPEDAYPCGDNETHCRCGVCKSFDSSRKPPYMEDTSLRDRLLILLVLPVTILIAVIILVVVAIFKCDAIRRRLRRESRGQHRDNNGQEPIQDNREQVLQLL